MCKVSIIMPCFNDGAYIEESISSVLKQTYKEIELIIINDGSTEDNTNKIFRCVQHIEAPTLYLLPKKYHLAKRFFHDLSSSPYLL